MSDIKRPVPSAPVQDLTGWQILAPFDIRESMEVSAAAKVSGKVAATIRTWCERYGIGRKIAGDWHVSRVALRMFLDGDNAALAAYLAGDRSSERVVLYFELAGVPAAQKEKKQKIQFPNNNGAAQTVAQ